MKASTEEPVTLGRYWEYLTAEDKKLIVHRLNCFWVVSVPNPGKYDIATLPFVSVDLAAHTAGFSIELVSKLHAMQNQDEKWLKKFKPKT